MSKLPYRMVFLATALFANNAVFAESFLDADFEFRVTPEFGCELIGSPLVAEMQNMPLYEFDGAQCKSVMPSVSGQYYADAACKSLITFRSTSHQEFCDETLRNSDISDSPVIPNEWVLSTGTTYDTSIASLAGLTQPYRTTVTYLTHDDDKGECRLDMRIYKNHPDNNHPDNSHEPLRPLLAIHGGTWSSRDVGILGIENAVARYTDKGFVVFAPFFRLLSDYDGGACSESTMAEILSDLETALFWVENNAQHYGASGKPVLFGQSSGAQSALALSVAYPQRVAASVLMYPITDFGDFLSQIQSGEYDDFYGKIALSAVFGHYESVGLDERFIVDNSHPEIIQNQSVQYPPMLIVHGESDELVPASQAIRLCNALAGRDLDFKLSTADNLSKRLSCGEDHELNLIAEAGHALEICVSTYELLSFSCLAGDADTQQIIANLIEDASRWAARKAAESNTVVHSQVISSDAPVVSAEIVSAEIASAEVASVQIDPSLAIEPAATDGTGEEIDNASSAAQNPSLTEPEPISRVAAFGGGTLLMPVSFYLLVVAMFWARRTRII